MMNAVAKMLTGFLNPMSFAADGLVAELTFPIGEAVAAEPRPPGGLAVAV